MKVSPAADHGQPTFSLLLPGQQGDRGQLAGRAGTAAGVQLGQGNLLNSSVN